MALQGILKINHITDKILADSVPEVVIVRPGWFQENWAEALQTAQSDETYFETYFTPLDHPITMVRRAIKKETFPLSN